MFLINRIKPKTKNRLCKTLTCFLLPSLFPICVFAAISTGTGLVNQTIFNALNKKVKNLERVIGHNDFSIKKDTNGNAVEIRVKSGVFTKKHGSRFRIITPILFFLFLSFLLWIKQKTPLSYGFYTATLLISMILLFNAIARYNNGGNFFPSLTCLTSSMMFYPLIFAINAINCGKTKDFLSNTQEISVNERRLWFDYYVTVLKTLGSILLIGTFTFGYKLTTGFQSSHPPIIEDYFQYYSIVLFSLAVFGYIFGILIPYWRRFNRITFSKTKKKVKPGFII